jgi:hypothetical protein
MYLSISIIAHRRFINPSIGADLSRAPPICNLPIKSGNAILSAAKDLHPPVHQILRCAQSLPSTK